MNQFLLKIINDYPATFPAAVLIFAVIAAWHMSMTYSTFRYMKDSMVTKKDLEIALLKTAMEMDDRYVRRKHGEAA